MEIIIKFEPKEIAVPVPDIQERQEKINDNEATARLFNVLASTCAQSIGSINGKERLFRLKP